MTPRVAVVNDDESIEQAALVLANNDVGSVPVRGSQDGHLRGILTDRDIVTRVVAKGRVPSDVKVSEIVQTDLVVTVGAEEDVEVAIEKMKRHRVRRLPVLEGHELAGMLTQADIARSQPEERVGDLLGEISVESKRTNH